MAYPMILPSSGVRYKLTLAKQLVEAQLRSLLLLLLLSQLKPGDGKIEGQRRKSDLPYMIPHEPHARLQNLQAP